MVGTIAPAAAPSTSFASWRALSPGRARLPIGIPANMVFALVVGTAILRYRLFDVSAVRSHRGLHMVWAVSVCLLLGY
jgi:hypothetical protein